jgi:hypothetical protein
VSELAIPEVIEGEIVAQSNLFGTADPAEVVARATATADALIKVVHDKQLIKRIGSSDHVLVEAWTLLGAMLGVFPVCQWTRKLEDGWEARVVVQTLTGAIVGAAEAECLRSEKNWSNRDDYALRSMAQTRATSKAMRGPLGFVVTLAGFNPTPAEEMPTDGRLLSEPDASSPLPSEVSGTTPNVSGSESDPVFTFGKHKGKRVSETPVAYRQWLVENYTPTDEHGGTILDAVKESLVPF